MTGASHHPLYMLDAKLPARISDIIQQHTLKHTTNITVTDIVNTLRSTHGEYRRKPVAVLTGQVQRCIQVKQAEAIKQQQQQQTVDLPTRSSSGQPSDVVEIDMTTIASATITNQTIASNNSSTQRVVKRSANGGEQIDVTVSDHESDSDAANNKLAELTGNNTANNTLRTLYGCPPASSTAETVPVTPQRLAASVSNMHIRKQSVANSSSNKKHKSNGAYMGNSQNTSNTQASFDTVFTVPTVTLQQVGGIENVLQDIRELIEYPLLHPEIYSHLGIEPQHGILLHGPPGCGKTMLANAIAGELQIPICSVSAPELVTGMSGESEQRIRQLFADALANAPCILFVDEIDVIMAKREQAQREMERRMVAQFLTCMDSLAGASDSVHEPNNKTVIVIGATNRPDSLDSALRRAGRFDREIALTIPDQRCRRQILETMCKSVRVEDTLDYEQITRKAGGYVGADLAALVKEAAVIAVNRIFNALPVSSIDSDDVFDMSDTNGINHTENDMNGAADGMADAMADDFAAVNALINSDADAHMTATQRRLQHDLMNRSSASSLLRSHATPLSTTQLAPLSITTADFLSAITKVQPSSQREGFATVPDVTWNDIGALDTLREELNMYILQPILHPEQYISIGLTVPAGVLLFGPPGCGKTLVAKAIAAESGASFLSVKGPELLNQYVGQSEKAVRNVFQRARSSSPCVIFFDELDALAPRRGSDGGGGSQVSERVVNQLLTELDGLDERKQIFVIAATNRPDIIDPAMLRPGRLDKLLYCKLPDADERYAILCKHTRATPMDDTVNLHTIAFDQRAAGYSGADCAALVREASVAALREAQRAYMNQFGSGATAGSKPTLRVTVQSSHFEYAFSKTYPSVSEQSRQRYDRMYVQLCRARSVIGSETANTDDPLEAQSPNAEQTVT